MMHRYTSSVDILSQADTGTVLLMLADVADGAGTGVLEMFGRPSV